MYNDFHEEPKSVIILAAGDGSRLKSSTPKIFHKIGGLSLVEHVIKTSGEINPQEIVLVLKPQYESFKLEINLDVKKSFQHKPMGTGDAVKFGLEKLTKRDEGWVYILYGDIPLISSKSLQAMYEIAKQNTNTAVVVLAFDSSDSNDLGKLEASDKPGEIKSIIEAKDINDNSKIIPLCNAGLLVRRDILNKLLSLLKPSKITNEIYITEIVKLAYEYGYINKYYQASKEELSGVNTRSEMAQLERYFQDKMRKQCLDNGVTLISPETVFFSYDTEIETDVIIHPYVVFGKGVKVCSGSEIESFCSIEGAVIHKSSIGPFARLRKGSKICSNAKIGNFVEVKNSIIGEKSKVNHLTYIGDSSVGHDTNIGAGTITCNYDGFKKFKTEIGDNVFIGSNSALVAPVKIDDGAIIGAGSVITKDVSTNSLSIARGKQKNIEKWAWNFRESRKNK